MTYQVIDRKTGQILSETSMDTTAFQVAHVYNKKGIETLVLAKYDDGITSITRLVELKIDA